MVFDDSRMRRWGSKSFDGFRIHEKLVVMMARELSMTLSAPAGAFLAHVRLETRNQHSIWVFQKNKKQPLRHFTDSTKEFHLVFLYVRE